MHPHGRLLMGRCSERLLPHCRRGISVDEVTRRADRSAGRVVVVAQRTGAVACSRRTGARCRPQSPKDISEVLREAARVPDPLGRCALPGHPAVDRPFVGVTTTGCTDYDGFGHRDREMWREARQPLRIAAHLSDGPSDPRQPDHEVVADSPDRVVSPPRFHDHESPISQHRKL